MFVFTIRLNWPNHVTLDHQDAKNSKISHIFTKIAQKINPFRAKMRQNWITGRV